MRAASSSSSSPTSLDSAPPLLLAVLVQVVSRSCQTLLEELLLRQPCSHQADCDSPPAEQLLGARLLLDLLSSTPQSPADIAHLPRPRPFGHGYPHNLMVDFCQTIYTCARNPEESLQLPHVDMPGLSEIGCISEEVVKQMIREISHVVGEIDENMDLMNIPECSIIPTVDVFFKCLCNLISFDSPPSSESTSLLCETNKNSDKFVVFECIVDESLPPVVIPVRIPKQCINRMSSLLSSLCVVPQQLLFFTGLRSTPGSLVRRCPPPRNLLLKAFNAPNIYSSRQGTRNIRSNSILTVGARALCKHAPRSSDGFWTQIFSNRAVPERFAAQPLTGSEAAKNEKAEAKLCEILDNCVWINLHTMLDAGRGNGLIHDGGFPSPDSVNLQKSASVCILEVRLPSGHGARWSWRNPWESTHHTLKKELERMQSREVFSDVPSQSPYQIEFRGFVEPMQVGGHEKKWKH